MRLPSDGSTRYAMFLFRSAAVLSHVLFTGVTISAKVNIVGATTARKVRSDFTGFLTRNMSYSVIERGAPYTADYRVYIREYRVC